MDIKELEQAVKRELAKINESFFAVGQMMPDGSTIKDFANQILGELKDEFVTNHSIDIDSKEYQSLCEVVSDALNEIN